MMIGIRFILARGCDLEKASAMLKEATEYRKTMNTDQILDAPYPLAPKIKEYDYYHSYGTYERMNEMSECMMMDGWA